MEDTNRSGARPKIWVVDDSPLEAEFAKTILEQQHDVQLFFDGATVIERVTQGILPDVLILDWHMPNVSGLEVCRFLRQSHDEASLPILILTATAGRDDLLEGLAAGANDFVTKEFDSAELVARVATLVRSRRLHDRAKQSELSARRALAVAEQASRAKDVFLATVSHELRNPLNALLGWVTLVARPSVDPALLRRGLEIIERNAKLQVQLIEDILDISRVVSGKLHLETRTVDVARIVQAVVESALPNAESRGLTVQTKLEPSAATVGDPDRLHQAFYNVLSNAMKFSRKGGKIEVSVRRVAEHVEVRIQDEGAGISPEFLPFVFDRFRQQDSTASRNHSGLGLGLALVKSIIEAHGGRVRVTSLGKNRGTTVVLDVPECDVRSSRQPSTETPSSPSAARRSHGQALVGVDVLVVEDDPDANELLGVLIQNEGGTVRQAYSADQALSLFSERKPTILLSDIGLPGADGYDLLRTLRARDCTDSIIAIAMTAYAGREDQRLASEAGYQAHVAKPADPNVLLSTMTTLLGSR